MEFDAKEQVEKVTEFVRNYFSEQRLSGAVVGLSGGKDSAVVLALLVRALGSENVVALTLPCHSSEEDRRLAEKVAVHFNVKTFNLDLSDTFDEFALEFKGAGFNESEKDLLNSKINLKPRLRTAALYYAAAMLSSLRKKTYIVVGTSNKCELFVGYFTKGGDNVSDLLLLADFTVSEVIKIGEELGVPEEVLYRTPSDGISGVSDEENLGVTYSDIEKYFENPESVSAQAKEKIEKLYNSSRHKFSVATYRRK